MSLDVAVRHAKHNKNTTKMRLRETFQVWLESKHNSQKSETNDSEFEECILIFSLLLWTTSRSSYKY